MGYRTYTCPSAARCGGCEWLNVPYPIQLKRKQAADAEKRATDKASAEILKERLKTIEVKVKAKAGEGGKVFGSVTSKDISDALKDQFGIEIDKKKIVVNSPIKMLGEYTVETKLYQEVNGEVKVLVEAL